MTAFLAQSRNGGLHLGEMADKFRAHLAKNPGMRYVIEPITPESRRQRSFFEGAVIPLVAFYQEGMDHRNGDDCRKVRDWVMAEFNPEMVVVNGKAKVVPGSSKGKLGKGLIDKVIDWIEENYGVKRQDVLNPNEYKHWRDAIYPYGGPANYIDYLQSVKKI